MQKIYQPIFLRMNIIYKFLSVFIVVILTTNLLYSQKISRSDYIEKYKDIAIRQMSQYGIPASIIMAQACLESDNGNSKLAVKANNHFGIKAHNWSGKIYYYNSDKRKESFRKYDSVEDSFIDHSEFLKNGSRYNFLFSYSSTDYVSWAKGLKKAGYATNPKYPELLIKIIKDNQLYKLDTKSYSKDDGDSSKDNSKKRNKRRDKKKNRKKNNAESVNDIKPVSKNDIDNSADSKNNSSVQQVNYAGNSYNFSLEREVYSIGRAKYIISAAGDTYSSLAKEFNLFTSEIISFNDLAYNVILNEGTVVYITRKNKRLNKRIYTVESDETLYEISQKLGIRLKSLLSINRYKGTDVVKAGSSVNLK